MSDQMQPEQSYPYYLATMTAERSARASAPQISAYSAGTSLRALAYVNQCAAKTGLVVTLLPELGHLPCVVAKNGSIVPVYQLVELIEENVDVDAILAELPDLTYSQVVGTIGFLRKLAQINANGFDLDAIEDARDAANETLIAELREALVNRNDIVYVHPQPDQNGG